jgi:hypothetical protein
MLVGQMIRMISKQAYYKLSDDLNELNHLKSIIPEIIKYL